MRQEPKNSSIPVPRFQCGGGILNHNVGTCSHGGMMDHTRFPTSEMHQGKFPDSLEFQSWKLNFKTEVYSISANPHVTMHRIKEVEIAKSIGELITSCSIFGRTDFPDNEMLDAMIASALKRLLDKHVHFRKKSKWRRATCSKIRPVLTRKADCLHDLRAFSCGAYAAVQGLSDLCNIRFAE